MGDEGRDARIIRYGGAVGPCPRLGADRVLVGFVRLYLRAGRLWLAWTVCGVRTLSLILNFVFTPNLNYREITGLRHISFLGETIVAPDGVKSHWMLISQFGLLLLVIFVVDAAVTVWLRGERRQGLLVGGSIVFFVAMGTAQLILTLWGIIHAPITVSLFYMAIVAVMSYELSQDVLRAARLSDDLSESQERMALATHAANLGIWVRDFVRNEVWVTDEWRTLFGFAKVGADRSRWLSAKAAPRRSRGIQPGH